MRFPRSGIATGCLVHIAAAALGLSAVMISPFRWPSMPCGMPAPRTSSGWARALFSRQAGLEVRRLEPVPLARIFRQGVVTNVLNPKVALFFLAFLPQFTDAARGPLPLQFVLLGLVFVANGTIVCLGYALAASWLGNWLKNRYGFSTWLNRAMGGLFIALGLRLAFDSRR